MTLNMPRFSLEQFFMAAFSTAESTERTGSTQRCFSRSDRKTVVMLASENPWKKTNKREKNQWFQGVEMLHHWLQRDNKWAEILGLFEAYLWILRQIFPPFVFVSLNSERDLHWGDGRRGSRRCERGRKFEVLGFLQTLGSSSEQGRGLFLLLCSGWDAVGTPGTRWSGSWACRAGPQINPGKIQWLVLLWFHRGQGWVSSPSSSWDGIFGKAGMTQTQIPGLRDPSCFERGFSVAVKFTLV